MPSDTSLPGATGANARYVRGLLAGYHLPLVADTPEARAEHDQHLMDAVAALHPEDDFEARLAVRIVAMGVHVDDALRSAGLAAADPAEVRRCRAQAVSMSRQADAMLRSLRRMQADRDKALAAMHPAAMGRAGYSFHEISVPTPAPQPAEAAPAPAPAELDEVELYEAMYPDRAARIRAAGGLPPDLDWGPPEPHIVAGLLRTGAPSHAARLNPANQDSETESSHRPGRLPRLAR
jgi:hypothetical protein